uniref:Uncharacterized protein n=1 Tax=Arundo donax TaxID=35708 RepID=A0A0A9FGQ1_ARUDO
MLLRLTTTQTIPVDINYNLALSNTVIMMFSGHYLVIVLRCVIQVQHVSCASLKSKDNPGMGYLVLVA